MESSSKKEPDKEKNECIEGKYSFESNRKLFWYAYLRIRETRRYWLLPVLLFLIVIGFFLNLFTGYNVLPAIYSLIP